MCIHGDEHPSIGKSLNECKNENIDVLIVVLLFLAKGVHILQDIPELLGLPEGVSKGTFPLNGKTIPMVYADPTGSAPLLADLVAQNAKSARELV